MTLEEARLAVLQRAVALLLADIDRNRLRGIAPLLTRPEDGEQMRAAATELARHIEAAEKPRTAGRAVAWPRRG